MIFEEDHFFWRAWRQRLLVFTLLLAILGLSIIPFWEKIGIYPCLILIALYYWTLYRPHLVPVEQLVLLSLVQDGIYAYPLGFSALRLLTDYTLLTTQKRILKSQRFLWTWGGFGIFALADGLVYLGLMSCIKKQWVDFMPVVPGIIMTVALFPLGVALANRVYARFFAV